jgi:hypothetical protein
VSERRWDGTWVIYPKAHTVADKIFRLCIDVGFGLNIGLLIINIPIVVFRCIPVPVSATVWALGYMTQVPSHLLSLTG